MSFRKGQLVRSTMNDLVKYKVTKVNKESLDLVTSSTDKNLNGHHYRGISKDYIVKC